LIDIKASAGTLGIISTPTEEVSMSIDTIVLSAIVLAFTIFGFTLFSVDLYSRRAK
jgi:hypothetical protein